MDISVVADKVRDGSRIQWVGMVDGYINALLVSPDGTKDMVAVHIGTDEATMPQFICSEPDAEVLATTVLPRDGDAGELRWAAVHGLNAGGSCKPGAAQIPMLPDGCVCGYDIETDISATTGNAFPLPESRIISLAMWCTCGYRLLISTEECSRRDVIYVATSRDLVREFCAAAIEHMPMWLIGWNSYTFDNYCMVIHAPEDSDTMFDRTVVRTQHGNRTGYILNFPGVYNVDLYVYLDRTQRDKYPRLGLGVVAQQLGAPAKTHMPNLSTESMEDMLEYNMNDSKITALLWGLTKANYAIPNMATVSCSPMYDCIRNVTGAMAADIVASECLSIGKCFGWANCPPTGKYQGGYVVAPVRGIHDSVAVCDFSSMYPTIMMGVNISPDSVLPQTESIRSEGAVTWDGKSAAVVCSGKVIRFSNVTQSVIPKVLRKLVDERKRHRAKFPNYANALKVAANSIYGSLGYEFSPLYSPSCSAATTAYGRWCLSLSICIFEKCGLSVLYGDTDSCFLTRTAVTGSKYGGDLRLHCNAALRVLKNILMFTPFRDMDMCLEDVHERVLLLEKKNYAYMSRSGDARYKGISAARKDALGICRKVSKCTVDMILNGGVSTDTKSAIALMYATALDSCALGSLALADVSKVIRSEGGNCYSYIDFNGNKKDVRVEDASPDSIVRYSKSEVATRITREITRYTSAAGLGGATDIMWWCPVFESLGISNR